MQTRALPAGKTIFTYLLFEDAAAHSGLDSVVRIKLQYFRPN